MTSKEEMRIRKLVQEFEPAEKVVPLVMKPQIQAQIEALELEMIEVRKEADTLAGNPEAVELGAKIDALTDSARDSVIQVTIRQLHRRVWSDLRAKYPHDNPMMYLYDSKIFEEAIPACWVSPEVGDETRDKILDKITDGQWDALAQAVKDVNGDVAIPFSALATRVRRASVASEPPQEPTE